MSKYQEALDKLYDGYKNGMAGRHYYDILQELVDKEAPISLITCILLGRKNNYIMAIGKDKFLKLPDDIYDKFTLKESIGYVEIYHANVNSTYFKNRINYVLRELENERNTSKI